MIDKYLPTGDLFALYDNDLKTVCVVAPIDSDTCELKNIATYEKYQGKGYGKALLKFIFDFYKNTKLCLSEQEKFRRSCHFMKVADLK
ncbi:MAG: GNAT family N-acetyltransferase [Marinilabiliaceae bacterium]|nr:GNAT family N-acetyltransferase [Marinilabiliaceae bacterium]